MSAEQAALKDVGARAGWKVSNPICRKYLQKELRSLTWTFIFCFRRRKSHFSYILQERESRQPTTTLSFSTIFPSPASSFNSSCARLYAHPVCRIAAAPCLPGAMAGLPYCLTCLPLPSFFLPWPVTLPLFHKGGMKTAGSSPLTQLLRWWWMGSFFPRGSGTPRFMCTWIHVCHLWQLDCQCTHVRAPACAQIDMLASFNLTPFSFIGWVGWAGTKALRLERASPKGASSLYLWVPCQLKLLCSKHYY